MSIVKLLSSAYRNAMPASCYYDNIIRLFTIKSPKKPVIIREEDLEEKFSRGSGPGGQSINKTMNRVQLLHKPTGAAVTCQEARDLTSNRAIARKWLRDKIDLMINGEDSKLAKRYERTRKRKRNAARRAKKKYGLKGDIGDEVANCSIGVNSSDCGDEDGDGDDEEDDIDSDDDDECDCEPKVNDENDNIVSVSKIMTIANTPTMKARAVKRNP